jgi:catechol 2,3-dioxygenase-like lactoylglutathione lyase family enzyme
MFIIEFDKVSPKSSKIKITKMKICLIITTLIFSQLSLSAKESNFSSQTIDIGLVVSDIKKSLKFYKDVVGFNEKEGFKVTGDFPRKVGLTDGAALTISVLSLGEDESCTKLKLMQVKGKKPTKIVKQPFIHSIAGFSYLTIFVNDVDKVLNNAKSHGYKPYAQSPQILPEGLPQDVCLLMLKDPDGNFVEIVGPLSKKLR